MLACEQASTVADIGVILIVLTIVLCVTYVRITRIRAGK